MNPTPLPILYVRSGSSRCREAAQCLVDMGISYLQKNIDRDPAAASTLARLSTVRETPTLDWHGEVLVGFTSYELANFLQSLEVEMEDS